MSTANAGYYKSFKEKLYSIVRYLTDFAYNISLVHGTPAFAIPAGDTTFQIILRRGPCFWQSGFKGSVYNIVGGNPANFNNETILRNIYITQKTNSGYVIVNKVSLAELFGGPNFMGDSYRPVPWQWIAGETMFFTINNPTNAAYHLSMTLLGRNVYASK